MLLIGAFASVARAAEERPWILGGPRASFTEPLVSERPSFSTSPDATPPGRINAELGFELGRNDRGEPESERVRLPAALFRLGLLDRLEARLGWSGYEARRVDGQEEDDFVGPMLGVKWQLNEGVGGWPRMGLLAEVVIPVESGPDPDFLAGLAWRHGLSDAISLFGTSTVGVEGGELFVSTHAAGLSWSFAPAWSVYGEYDATVDENAHDTHTLDAGLAWLLTPNVQLDLYGGAGLNAAARDGFVGAGVAWRM
ncbi:MAG: transporter [Myxococcota bacterium]